MKNFKDMFKSENIENIPDYFWSSKNTTCYYPSSGYDFRHIFYWDYYCKKNNIPFPEIFIHSDFSCLDWNPYPKEYLGFYEYFYRSREMEGKKIPHPLLYNGYILDVFGNGNSLVIKNWTELFLNNDVFYPNKELFNYSDRINEETHKVFAIQCQLINIERDVLSLEKGDTILSLSGEPYEVVVSYDKRHHNNMCVINKNGDFVRLGYNYFLYPSATQLSIVLFTMENSNLFYDVILKNQINIDYLTHINDGGGSMGGSKDSMDFMYLYSDTLGLKNMIVDRTLNEKQEYIKGWEKRNYFNPKVKREPINKKASELKKEEWAESNVFFPESLGIYISNKAGSGNKNWNYSDFNKIPLSINEAHEKGMRIKEKGSFIDEYYHYSKK